MSLMCCKPVRPRSMCRAPLCLLATSLSGSVVVFLCRGSAARLQFALRAWLIGYPLNDRPRLLFLLDRILHRMVRRASALQIKCSHVVSQSESSSDLHGFGTRRTVVRCSIVGCSQIYERECLEVQMYHDRYQR